MSDQEASPLLGSFALDLGVEGPRQTEHDRKSHRETEYGENP